MIQPRRHHNATLLPDGAILVTGGTNLAGFNEAPEMLLESEIWDPETELWSPLAPAAVHRLYHSTALLLPDGRVLSAGGGRPSASGEVDHKNMEIFHPPYLFRGPRPVITSAPESVTYGETFRVETPNAATIAKITLIRLGSVTHAFDQNQRLVTLTFTPVENALEVAVPSNPNAAPPGDYMLFLVDLDGVPSVAPFIRLSPGS